MSFVVLFQKTSPDAHAPFKAHDSDAGYDLHSCEEVAIAPGERKLISTGIRMALDEGFYGRISPRSGLASKGKDIGGGIIDSGYRGEIKVILINHSEDHFHVHKGDRIAQIIIQRHESPKFQEIPLHAQLPESSRGAQGFGSSGMAPNQN